MVVYNWTTTVSDKPVRIWLLKAVSTIGSHVVPRHLLIIPVLYFQTGYMHYHKRYQDADSAAEECR